MIVMNRIGQSVLAAFAAIILSATTVAAAAGPLPAHHIASAPAGLVAAPLSSQAAA
jgi:hypothetical protein